MDSSTPSPVRVGIVGATGYAGVEIVRLLHDHPGAEITLLGSQSSAGKQMGDVFTHLDVHTAALPLTAFDQTVHLDAADVFFLALANGQAMQIVPALLRAGKRVIDISADYRIRSQSTYETWYKIKHVSANLLPDAVYGLAEIYGTQIRTAGLVANPGCYTTTSILALAPALACKAIDPKSIIVDAMSGISGAGRSKATTEYLFTELDGNAKAYGIAGHRHTPEIEQELTTVCGSEVRITFTPHLVPMTRGILATCYANLCAAETIGSLHAFYEEFYADAPFVEILPLGRFPAVMDVAGSNMCRIGIAMDKRTKRLIVVSATDNLIKGAGGQAVQNFNIMIGYPETTNLPRIALYP
jgi:N-acetyl-gamma-glutamyl-phosphate reductase